MTTSPEPRRAPATPDPEPSGDRPAVRVVTIVYNPGPELTDFTRSLATATTAPVELVLVDNGADPEVADRVAAEAGGRVVRTGENLGYGGGANAGARGATQPFLVVANPDVVWEPGSLDALLDAAERNPTAGALGPALLNEDGTVYPSARELPSLTQGAGHAVLGGVSWKAKPAAMISAHHRSAERYLHRRYHRWYHWPVRVAVSAGLKGREVVELRRAR